MAFTPANAVQNGAIGHNARRKGHTVKARSQAVNLRDLCYKEAMSTQTLPATDPRERIARAQALCQLVKSWSETCQQERIAKGKPLPGSLRPIAAPKKKRTSSALPVESVAPQVKPINDQGQT